ncbi:MAG: TonB-dependent receptor [Gammaproteobacteria bacterium]|nr:TonB-dependent receptor [Gammaproteobacteria bacterium]
MSRAFIQSILFASTVAASVSIPTQIIAEELPTVVVSAARTEQSTVTIPAAINIITQDDIQASGASNVSEVLRNQGGIYLTDYFGTGTHASIAMRGFSSEVAASNTLIIVDGRRLNNIDLSGPDLNSISIKNIERIEIIQGSAGALYGDQAVGGVINIITKSPTAASKELELSAGSYNRQRITAKIEDRVSDKISYRLTGDYLESDNYRDNNTQQNSDVFGRLNYQLDGGLLFVEAQRVSEDMELPGPLSLAEVEQDRRQSAVDYLSDYSDSETDVMRLGIRQSLLENWLTEAELTSRDQRIDVQQSFTGWVVSAPSAIDYKQAEFTPRVIGVYPMDNREMMVTLGADLLDTDYSSELTAITDVQKQQSYYAQLVVSFMTKWHLTMGSRHAMVENDVVSLYKTGNVDSSVTVAEYGLSYSPVDSVRLFVRLDENFRFAKVDELTYTSPGVELETQTGESRELGVEFKQPEYSVRAVIYRLALNDEIAFDPTVPQPTGAFYAGANVNFDPTTHDGLIVDAHYQLTQALAFNASFTYNDAVFDSGVFEGNTISGVPEKVFILTTDYKQNDNWHYFVELSYTGEYYLSGDNANLLGKQSSYSIVNANINYDRKAWSFSARINNLLNKEYIESANSWLAYYPSPERNFWLSAAYRF